jgi:hypothetical protein
MLCPAVIAFGPVRRRAYRAEVRAGESVLQNIY